MLRMNYIKRFSRPRKRHLPVCVDPLNAVGSVRERTPLTHHYIHHPINTDGRTFPSSINPIPTRMFAPPVTFGFRTRRVRERTPLTHYYIRHPINTDGRVCRSVCSPLNAVGSVRERTLRSLVLVFAFTRAASLCRCDMVRGVALAFAVTCMLRRVNKHCPLPLSGDSK